MTESPTRRERIVTDLSSINTLVILVAIVLAVSITGATWMSGIEFDAGFLLLLSIGVCIPDVYERYWPGEYTPVGAIAWTIAMGLVTAALFIGSYQLFVASMETISAAVAAYILTTVVQYSSAIGYRRISE